jgi:hypothetical protein
MLFWCLPRKHNLPVSSDAYLQVGADGVVACAPDHEVMGAKPKAIWPSPQETQLTHFSSASLQNTPKNSSCFSVASLKNTTFLFYCLPAGGR